MIMLWALVPVKELSRSKQRLATALEPDDREGLVFAMLQDVLTAIRDISVIDGILVISRSPKVRKLAREFGYETFVDSDCSDHSQAVTEANSYLNSRIQPQSTLALPGDVPRMTAEDIQQIIANHDRVTLVPNESGEGTNAVLASPPNVISYHFGEQSLRKHTEAARLAGLPPSVVRNSNMAKDIDDPRDLVQALTDLPPSFTRDFLQNSGIASRVSDGSISTVARYG